MTAFQYADVPVRDGIASAQRAAWERIAGPGSWWTGAQRVEIARQARAARVARAEPPWLREGLPDAGDRLPEAAVEAARTIAADAHKIERDWAERTVAALGDAAYVELAAVAVCICAIDTYAEALGADLEPLPDPRAGAPDRTRPESVVDAGAYVPLQVPWQGPNVGRALSLAPQDNIMFMTLVMAMYGGPGGSFFELVWKDTPLSRPQTELLAARVSAVNECFY